jgi:hypothetical protein
MFKDYLQLCWLSGYPDDLPTDRRFLYINLAVYFLLGQSNGEIIKSE